MLTFRPHHFGVLAFLAGFLGAPAFGQVTATVGSLKTCQKIEVTEEDITSRCKATRLGGGTACTNEGTQCLNKISGGDAVIETGACMTVQDPDALPGVKKCSCISASSVAQIAAIDFLVDSLDAAQQFPAVNASVGLSAACSQLDVLLTGMQQAAADLEQAVCLDLFIPKVAGQMDRIITGVSGLVSNAAECGISFDAPGVRECVLFKKNQTLGFTTVD